MTTKRTRPKLPAPANDVETGSPRRAKAAGHAWAFLARFRRGAFGLEPLLLQSAWFRPHNRSEDVEGLYMVGAGTHPGAGIPGVLMSAKALEAVLPPIETPQAMPALATAGA